MYYYTISISFCLAILSACAADKTGQAYSSISYHRHDVPLSYNFSQVHIYTKSPENTPVKHIKPHKHQIEQHTNTIDVEKKHKNIQENIPQENQHDDNERNIQPQQIHNDLPSDILQHVETLEAVNHQARNEHIKEHPQGFAYSQTQKHNTAAYNKIIYFNGVPIHYYLNRAANLKSKAPEESIDTNSLESQNENVHYPQNKEPNQQHPSFQQQYTAPAIQLSEAYSHNIANVPNKAFTKVYNVERPQYHHERH